MIPVAKSLIDSPYATWLVLFLPAPNLILALVEDDRYYAEIMYESGILSTQLMVLALAITPLLRLCRNWPAGLSIMRWLQRRRRYIGVAAFGYALLHTLFYIREIGDAELILLELAEFSLATGWLAFAVILMLAVTSNDWSVRKLGRNWKRLQMIVYAAMALTFLHWWLIGQFLDQLLYWAVPILLLQLHRIVRMN